MDGHQIDAELFTELLALAKLRGIKPLDARKAILKTEDPLALRSTWREAYRRESARILIRADERELDRMADEGRVRHAQHQRAFQQETRARRKHLTLGHRLDDALAKITILPGLATPDFVPSGSSAPQAEAPPVAEHLEIETHLKVIESRIELIEAELDSAQGHSTVKNWAMATSDEKDREILSKRWAGVHSRDIASANPELGTERAIRFVRSRAGLTNYGHAKQEGKRDDGKRYAKT